MTEVGDRVQVRAFYRSNGEVARGEVVQLKGKGECLVRMDADAASQRWARADGLSLWWSEMMEPA